METLHARVVNLIEQQPKLLLGEIAQTLGLSELEVVEALPSEMVGIAPGDQAQAILETLADFGPVTTIMHAGGSIFEVKAPFPKGSMARGYYNLLGAPGELHGHLLLDNIQCVALISKPFMGKESHYFGFFSRQGENIFKVYLGRDEQRRLFAEQVNRFKQLQNQFRSPVKQ